MSGKHVWYDCVWEVRHKRNGQVIWSETRRNALADEGEESMLRSYFRNESSPTVFYVRLCNDSLVETDSLSDVLNEPVGNGYTPQTLERSSVGFPTVESDGGDYRVVSKLITFTATGGDIGPVSTAYLATTSDNTGKLIAYDTLSITRTIIDGDELEGQLRIKLQ